MQENEKWRNVTALVSDLPQIHGHSCLGPDSDPSQPDQWEQYLLCGVNNIAIMRRRRNNNIWLQNETSLNECLWQMSIWLDDYIGDDNVKSMSEKVLNSK